MGTGTQYLLQIDKVSTLFDSLSLTHTHILFLSHAHTLSLSHTHARSLSHTHQCRLINPVGTGTQYLLQIDKVSPTLHASKSHSG